MNKGLSRLFGLRAGKDVFIQNVQTVCGATLPTLPTQSTLPSTPWIAVVPSLEVKRPECEVDYSHPYRE
jgi:hypothetical protein